MAVLHLVERRESLQELQSALDVLQDGSPARLAVGVLFAHETDRIATPNYIYLYIGAGLVVLGPHGRLAAVWCPLDVSLWAGCDQFHKVLSYRLSRQFS